MIDPPASLLGTMRKVTLHLSGGQFLLTLVLVTLSATGSFAAAHYYGEVAAALVFVLGITVAGALCGLASALIAALVAFLIYNFYLTEPVLTFRLATGSDIAPLVIFNLCALVSGVLAGRLKDHAEAARSSNLQLNSLLELSRELQSAQRLEDVVATVGKAAHEILGARVALFRADGEDLIPLLSPSNNGQWRRFAETLLSSPAPMRQGTLIGRRLDGGTALPIVMIVEPFRPRGFEPAFVDALGNVVALALQRAALSEQMTERRASARAEELKTALLASVSHDFRTPLTAISASASSLITYGEKLDPETSLRLLQGIVEEGERLNRYTANLLEMSRLESGSGPASLQVLGVSEMVAAAIQRVRSRAGARTIVLQHPESDLQIVANPALFELVLINILDNAITYSEEFTRIRIEISGGDGLCDIVIADEGYGIPAQDAERVFDRFYRVARSEASPRGSGLGLAIAKGFVEALGGTIGATVPGIEGRGTRITISLPLVEGTGTT